MQYFLGIRYPEELSLKKPIDKDDLQHNYLDPKAKKSSTGTPNRNNDSSVLNNSRSIPKDTNMYIMEGGNTTMNNNSSHLHTPKNKQSSHLVGSPMHLVSKTPSLQVTFLSDRPL